MSTQYFPNYSYGSHCFDDIPEILKTYPYQRIVFIGGEKALASSTDEVRTILTQNNYDITGELIYGKEASMTNIKRLLDEPAVQNADLIFAFGGGKALDTVKMVAKLADKPFMTFPTICSTCAASTTVAVLYHDDHRFDHCGQANAPLHIFINTSVITKAPSIFLFAGIADGISKGPEVAYAMTQAEQSGIIPNHTAKLGRAIALSSEESLYNHGKKLLSSLSQDKANLSLEEVALAIIISTGFASNLENQPTHFYSTCHAHAFYNGSTSVHREGHFLHGMVVAFGVMVLHAYFDNDSDLLKVAKFNQEMGFPTCLADINLTEDDIPTIVTAAKNTLEYRYTPFEDKAFAQAILKANQVGLECRQ